MPVWIDGDACPKRIKEILYRAAKRTHTPLILVANHRVPIPASPFIKHYQVPGGFDAADKYIVDNLNAGDLVITADIPFADAVVDKGGTALNPRGEKYTAENIKHHLARRNRNEELRGSGVQTGGPDSLSPQDIQRFANALDTFLAGKL